jgi:hypothetical protein
MPIGVVVDALNERVLETNEAHLLRHPTQLKSCSHCRWNHLGVKKWCSSPLLTYKDPVSQRDVCPFQQRPAYVEVGFSIGCSLCAAFANSENFVPSKTYRKNVFSKFEVCEVRLQELVRHVGSRLHQDALEWLAISSLTGDKPLEAISTASASIGQSVPRAERFVWTIQATHGMNSGRDYAKFLDANDLTSMASVGGVMRDASKQSFFKQLRCLGSVCDDSHTELLGRARRLAFAFDDRAQLFALRVRLTVTTPLVESHEFLASVTRDFGYEIEDSADAAWACLTHLATPQRGRRDIHMRHGPGDKVDPKKLRRLQEITFQGCTDGCAVALQSVQLLKTSGRLPNLRYAFRDKPHTSRTVMSAVLKRLHHDRPSHLLEMLITGKKSFCRRAKNSLRFRHVWKTVQKECDPPSTFPCPPRSTSMFFGDKP